MRSDGNYLEGMRLRTSRRVLAWSLYDRTLAERGVTRAPNILVAHKLWLFVFMYRLHPWKRHKILLWFNVSHVYFIFAPYQATLAPFHAHFFDFCLLWNEMPQLCRYAVMHRYTFRSSPSINDNILQLISAFDAIIGKYLKSNSIVGN